MVAEHSQDRLIIEKAEIVYTPPLSNQPITVRLAKSVTDIEILEHIDKPYLTGYIQFLDTVGVYDQVRFSGLETLNLSLRWPDRSDSIERTFIIDKVVNVNKSQDSRAASVTLHFVEKIAFESTFLNVNKMYQGTTREIIEKIVKEYFTDYQLSKEDTSEEKERMRVVVPNMRPLQACNWIKDRGVSVSGLPFFLFSSIGNKETLHYISLASILEGVTIDDDIEYVYSQQTASAAVDDKSGQVFKFVIRAISVKNNSDISTLIAKSLVSATHDFWDTTTGGVAAPVTYNVKDALTRSTDIKREDFIFTNKYDYNGEDITDIINRKSFHIYSTKTYNFRKSLRETVSWNSMVNSKAFRNLLVSNPIDISVSGRNFFNEGVNKTIGNLINLRFLNNSVADANNIDDATDQVRSGRHMIYAARHIIRKEKYDVTLTCVKLENLK